jgi:hypothetical protein
VLLGFPFIFLENFISSAADLLVSAFVCLRLAYVNYVDRSSACAPRSPDAKTKPPPPQPHPKVVEALNQLLTTTFTVGLRRVTFYPEESS